MSINAFRKLKLFQTALSSSRASYINLFSIQHTLLPEKCKLVMKKNDHLDYNSVWFVYIAGLAIVSDTSLIITMKVAIYNFANAYLLHLCNTLGSILLVY